MQVRFCMKYKTKTQLARMVVEKVVREGKVLELKADDVPAEWGVGGACFVTLEVDGKLHGCIGTIEAYRPLYQDVLENAVSAATRDWRFPPLMVAEIEPSRLGVEVSVLSPMRLYKPQNAESLLNYLKGKKPGLVIEKAERRAVFLPQVWEELPEPESFLRHLCLKAGLTSEAWREGMAFWTFMVTSER